MAKKNTKSRYWVDDNSILPEIVVTPQGNYPVLDEAGNPARTVGAIQDINPNAHIYERVNTQPFMDDYIEGETNTAANQRADALDAQVVPHMGDFVSAATKPLDVLMPSRWVGLLDKDYNGLSVGDRLTRLFDEHNKGLYINDNPAGLFSKRFHDEHPIWAMAGNMAGDVLIGLGMKKTLDSSKNLYHSVIREPIPFSEKQAAAQRMNDFIHSADYIHKQKQAGLTDTEISDFQDMVARRLNSGDFPAYYSRINTDGMSVALPKPIGGIYMKRGLSPEDFLNAFDHEVAHYSTVNFGKSGNPYNKLARLVNKENPTTVEKMMDYNSGIVPLRPKSDALKIRKDRGLKTDATWLNKPKSQILLDYFQNDQEIRSNAYAIVQDAERRGMSVDDYIDFCTSPGGEIYRAAPTPIKYLNYVFTPENMKKFLKGFLSISAPAILTTNKTNKNVKAYGGLLELANKFKDGGSKDDYNTWKKKIGDYKGIIVDGDDTYDYYNFFKDNPQMAWDMLNDNPEAHFTDKYKTPNHPTFSNESIYSRPPYIQGGTWNDYSPTVIGQKWNYALSPSQVNSNWDVERTINYLADAENEGTYVTDSNGRYPIIDGTVLGGTLTPVTITPNNHSQGGPLKSASWNDLSMREKADIIKVGVKHGLNRLADIKSKYNELAFGGDTTLELDWSPQSWFGLRTPKPDGTLYNDQEAAILASHVPEYLQIEKTAKANGTWLKMPDGSTWTGDPRSWVMMQSEAYKKNYSPKPWYTGQAEWPTTFDYGNGAIETNKVTRAPYYNGQMWFSDNKSYGDTFANYIDKSGDNLLINPDYPDFKDPDRPIGRNFLSAVPQKGNYRSLTPPDDGTHDYWTGLPYDLKNNSIYRLDNSKIVIGEDKDGLLNTNIRADGNKVLTDDVVDWSKNLGDNGIYIHQVNDGPVVNTEDGSIYSPVINEFISQPGFTDKVKFIEGNTGDFDISNPYKYAYNIDKRNTLVTGNYAALGGNIYSGTKTASQQMNQQVKQEYIYDTLPQLYAMDGVNVRVSSGLRPNAVVYQNGRPTNRPSRHGMGQAVDIVPGEGATFNDIFRVLNNPNSNVSRWMRANGVGYIDETSATGTTKYWHDHKKDHSHVHHQIGGSPARQYATRFNVQQRPINKAWERRAASYWPKAQAMYQELLSAGVNPVAAAGILGNIAQESEFNPNAANSINGGHWGYLQNDKNITPWVRANYGGYDHRSQMNYLIAGLQGRLPKSNMGLDRRFNGFNARMQGVTDPEMAAYLWEREYEKSANEGVPQRKYFARYFYDRMIGNNGIAQQQYNPLMFNMEDPSQYNANAGMPENVDPELYYRELDRKKWEDNSYSSLLSSDANQDNTAVDRVQAVPESQASSFLKWIVPMLSSQSSSNTGNVLLNTINMLNYGTKSPDIYSSFNPFNLTV